jgi:hypothetical protein
MDRTTRTNSRDPKALSLFWITRGIIAPIFPAEVLSTRFVRRLFLAFLVANDALLR